MWLRNNLIYCIRSCCIVEANDVFNGMEAVTSCHPATLLACTTRRRVVGSLGTVAAQLPRVLEPLCTVAIHRERAAGLHYTVVVL
jgi:hypothetical protein